MVEFAKQLRAQLLLEVDDTIAPDDEIENILIDNLVDDPYQKKINGDFKNLNHLRDEVRERRLMLAN